MISSSSLRGLFFLPFVLSYAHASANNYEAGPSLTDEDIAFISEKTTQEDIEKKNGPPSYRCFFDRSNGRSICYFHQKKRGGEIEQQRQVQIDFHEDGTVSDVFVHELI